MARARKSLIVAPLAVLFLLSTSLTTLSWHQVRRVERMPFVFHGLVMDTEESSLLNRLFHASIVEVALTDVDGETFTFHAPDHSILQPLRVGDTTAVRSNVGELHGPKREERLCAALATLATMEASDQTTAEHRRVRDTLGRGEVLQLAHRRNLWDPVWAFGSLAIGALGVLLLALPRKQTEQSGLEYQPQQ